MSNFLKSKILHFFLKTIGYSLITIFLVGIILILLTPSLVSTLWFKQFVQKTINRQINRPATIEKISWRWKDGIWVTGISVENDPSFSEHPIFFLKKARLKINFSNLLSGQVGADILIDGIDANIIKDKEGKTNLETLIPAPVQEDISVDTKKEKSGAGVDLRALSFSLPIDIQADLKFENISFSFEDLLEKRKMSLENGVVVLSMPSMFFKPVHVITSGDIRLADQVPLPFDISILIQNKQTSEKTYDIGNMLIKMNGNLPGTVITLNGNLSDQGVKGRVTLDLQPITQTVKPFLSKDILNSEFYGNVELIMDAAMVSGQIIDFYSSVHLKDVAVTGEIVQNRQILPLNASLSFKGGLDLEKGELEIQNGDFDFLNHNHISLQARIKGLVGDPLMAEFNLGPFLFDIKELYNHTAPSIPEINPLKLKFYENPFTLKIDRLLFSGDLQSGVGSIGLTGFKINMSGVDLTSDGTDITVSNLIFLIPEIKSEIKDYLPTQVTLTTGLKVEKVNIQSASPIYLAKLDISELKLNITDIEKELKALLGVRAEVSLNQSLKLEKVSAPDLFAINNMLQSLNVHCLLPAEKKADIQIQGFKVSGSELSVLVPSIGEIKSPVSIEQTISHIFIHDTDPLSVDIANAETKAFLGDFVRLNITAEAHELAATEAVLKGNMSIDLGALSEYLPESFFKGLMISGDCDVEWDVKGRLPNKEEMDQLTRLANLDLKDHLKFVDHIDSSIAFADMDVNLRLTEKESIVLGPVSARPLLHYAFKDGNGKLKSHIMIDNIREIPGYAFKAPVSGEISITGTHEGLNNLTFSQEAEIKAFNLIERVTASISGINRMSKQDLGNPVPQLLKQAGANIQTSIQMSDIAALDQFQKDMALRGSFNLDASMVLVPDTSISVGLVTTFNQMSIQMEKLASVKDLHGNLNLFKVYNIDSQKEQVSEETVQGSELLSLRVMETLTSRPSYISSGVNLSPEYNMFTRFHSDQTIAFESAASDAGPVPIKISQFMAEIGLSQGLPELKRIQMDLLGGTIVGAFSIIQNNGLFYTYVWINFTGIDLAAFFPEQNQKTKKQDTEISGQLNLMIPLSTMLTTFLENVHVDVFFSHIGVRAIERLFYALDPYENNEAIVTQRRLLKTGSPRFIRLEVKDGYLSIEGEIGVKGARIQPIDINPINITNLSNFGTLEGMLDALVPVIEMLHIASSDTIHTGEAITFK